MLPHLIMHVHLEKGPHTESTQYPFHLHRIVRKIPGRIHSTHPLVQQKPLRKPIITPYLILKPCRKYESAPSVQSKVS